MRAQPRPSSLCRGRKKIMATKLDLEVKLPSFDIKLKGLKRGSCVKGLKTRIEQQAGILPHTYYLTYLDAAPLQEDRTLHDLEIVSGAVLRAVAWRLWQELVASTVRGAVRQCCEELRAIGDRGDEPWQNYCAWCSAFTAAHGGHHVLLAELLKGWPALAVNAQSPSGWTGLHAAAAMGRWKTLCILLDHGADVTVRDSQGTSAADLAHSNGHKKCEQSLRFCEWNIKKYRIVKERRWDHDAGREREAANRRAHQFTDSRNGTWLSGPRGSEYLLHIPNPDSVRDVHQFRASQQKTRESRLKLPPITATPSEETFDYGWFDKLRAQQLVPNTHHILTYSDPSSTSLQPRSLLNPNGYLLPSTLPREKHL